MRLRLRLVTCKIFSECKIFSSENIFGKRKYFQVFGCFMKIVLKKCCQVFGCIIKMVFSTSFSHFLNVQTNFIVENFSIYS